jgi:hypothetical protein
VRAESPAAINALYPHAGPLLADRWNEDLVADCYLGDLLDDRVLRHGHRELRGQGREVPDELLSFIAPGHRENINFFGFINVDIEAELATVFPPMSQTAGLSRLRSQGQFLK